MGYSYFPLYENKRESWIHSKHLLKRGIFSSTMFKLCFHSEVKYNKSAYFGIVYTRCNKPELQYFCVLTVIEAVTVYVAIVRRLLS